MKHRIKSYKIHLGRELNLPCFGVATLEIEEGNM